MENEEIKISKQHKIFCENYIATLNATEAYFITYNQKNRNTCKVNASKLLKKPEIQAYIKKLMQEKVDSEIVADQNEVLKYFTDVMRGKIKDQFDLDPSLKERNKAAELLGKKYGMFVERREVDTNATVNLLDDVSE